MENDLKAVILMDILWDVAVAMNFGQSHNQETNPWFHLQGASSTFHVSLDVPWDTVVKDCAGLQKLLDGYIMHN